MNGGFGNDELRGGYGHDILDGGFGKDILYGGGGRNTFNNNDDESSIMFSRITTPQPTHRQAPQRRQCRHREEDLTILCTTDELSIRQLNDGLGIFASGSLEAIVTDSNWSAATWAATSLLMPQGSGETWLVAEKPVTPIDLA